MQFTERLEMSHPIKMIGRSPAFAFVFFSVFFCNIASGEPLIDARLLIAKKDYFGAEIILKSEADKGDVEAQAELGSLYDTYGEKIHNDILSEKYFRLAADRGNSFAQYRLALNLLFGNGVSENKPEAAVYFKKAADQGEIRAKSYLGLMLSTGQGVQRDLRKAVEYTEGAAQGGWTPAITRLGLHYRDGMGVAQDFGKAIALFEEADQKGDQEAAGLLGDCYYDGIVVQKDFKKALHYYSRATIVASAQYHLGLMYYNGYGTSIDYKKAEEFFRHAASPRIANHKKSQLWLGFLYDSGKSVPQNFELAYMWYNIAATDGDQEAIKFRDAVFSKLSPTQIYQAQQKTRMCLDGSNILCFQFD